MLDAIGGSTDAPSGVRNRRKKGDFGEDRDRRQLLREASSLAFLTLIACYGGIVSFRHVHGISIPTDHQDDLESNTFGDRKA
jgi:hypothetical protein